MQKWTVIKMSKSVLISIQPKGCKLIASGRKIVEVRKSCPKLKPPFKVYIYCTRGKGNDRNSLLYCSRNYGILTTKKSYADFLIGRGHTILSKKIIGEFICDKIYRYSTSLAFQSDNDISTEEIVNRSCLSEIELFKYEYPTTSKEFGVIKVGLFAWNISDLVIYDTPKELSELDKTKPPQSWCYVYESGDKNAEMS